MTGSVAEPRRRQRTGYTQGIARSRKVRTVTAMAAVKSVEKRLNAASRTNNETIMLVLANDRSAKVRLALAGRHDLPVAVQLVLAGDEAYNVCAAVADRAADPRVVAALTAHYKWGRQIAYRFSANKNTGADTITYLLDNGLPPDAVAGHPNLPAERLRRVLIDPELSQSGVLAAFLAGRGRLGWYRPADLERLDVTNSARAAEYTALLAGSGNPALYRELAATWSGTADHLRETVINLGAGTAAIA